MANLIDKSALVAEIKRLNQKARELYGYSQFNDAYNNVLESINTLEVKEVDLEKEIIHYFEGWGNNEIHSFAMMQDGTSVGIDECIDIAKHFFELGLKSRKEDKVLQQL